MQCDIDSLRSEYLKDSQLDATRLADALGYEDVFHEPCMCPIARFEARRRAKVDCRRVHGFTAPNPFHGFRRAMAQPEVLDKNARAVRRFDDVPRMRFRYAVIAEQLKIRPGGKDATGKAQPARCSPDTYETLRAAHGQHAGSAGTGP
jgi:hypothetical protein